MAGTVAPVGPARVGLSEAVTGGVVPTGDDDPPEIDGAAPAPSSPSTIRATSVWRPVTDRIAVSTADRCCSHFSRWTVFGSENVTRSVVLVSNVAGA